MDKRPDNVFQFLEVERKPPAKIGLVTRKTAFREIYEPVTEANLRDQAHRCLACGNPYCQWRCPVHNLIPDWLRLMARARWRRRPNSATRPTPCPRSAAGSAPRTGSVKAPAP